MKNHLSLLTRSIFIFGLISLAFFTGCKDDQEETLVSKIHFGFKADTSSTDNGRIATMEAAYVSVSIEDVNGNLVEDLKEVNLLRFNNEYISEKISLLPGTYNLVEFFVLDADKNVIYASPRTGSQLAYLVERPLPISFTVVSDEVTKVEPEVLSVQGASIEDFGYSSFTYNLKKTFEFRLAVSTYNLSTSSLQLTNANISISNPDSVVYTGTLGDSTNTFRLNDINTSYSLLIEKEGYQSFNQTFTTDSLKKHLYDPLEVTLMKTFTFTIDSVANVNHLTVKNESGKIISIHRMDPGTNEILIKSESASYTFSFVSVTRVPDEEGGRYIKSQYYHANVSLSGSDILQYSSTPYQVSLVEDTATPRGENSFDYENVFWDSNLPLYGLRSDEVISPDANGVYKYWYSTNEDPNVYYAERSSQIVHYKFKTYEHCYFWTEWKKNAVTEVYF
jgi:hypothetical protein